MAPALLDLPLEILHSILALIDPADLRAFCLCSRWAYGLVKHDKLLIKHLLLNNFDDPRIRRGRSDQDGEPHWEDLLHTYVRTSKILGSGDVEMQKREIDYVLNGVQLLLDNSTASSSSELSQNTRLLVDHLGRSNRSNLDVFVCGSSLFVWAERDAWRRNACRTLDQNANGDVSSAQEQHPAHYSSSDTTNHFSSGFASVQIPPARAAGGTEREPSDSPAVARRRAMAKLHSLYGVPIQTVHKGLGRPTSSRYSLRADSALMHPYVRSNVYDLRQHTDGTFWGPFLDDGSQDVDWEKIEAIMLILDHNMSCFARAHEVFNENAIPDWSKPFHGATPYSYVSRKVNITKQPSVPLQAQDPYNVTGTWMRVVCFLDYTELYDFNFGNGYPAANEPRPPLFTEEATRLITMRIHVTKIEPPGEDDGKGLPVVHFRGTSSSVRPSWDPNANSSIRGMVKLTPQGEVRWTTWSIFHGEERWRSEGIQVGGVQSARGVIGFWFDKDFDVHGPAGPTAFWKSFDGIEVEPRSNIMQNSLHALHVPLY